MVYMRVMYDADKLIMAEIQEHVKQTGLAAFALCRGMSYFY